ncbi:MAG: S41 family peptidase, partial [Verrucomicrobia bacterium]|nr:S41 family peptidase [Verrucomicrobiota bacterium]
MKSRIVYGLLIFALALNLLAGAKIFRANKTAAKDNPGPSLELFSSVLDRVRSDYVDGTNLTSKELVYSALKGMVNTLDPHSEFLDPERYKQLQDDTQGAFGGLGIVIAIKEKAITVVAPIEDSPGFKAGILTGDRIVKIAGKSAEKMSLEEAVKNLRGEPGTEVAVSFFRPSTKVTLDLKLKRAVISIDMVKDVNSKKEFPLGADKVGYVRLVQFSEKTGAELEAALTKLKAQGMRALILDLRWNPGGLLDQAVEVCGKFLARGRLVVSTEGRNPLNNSTHRAMGQGDELTDQNGKPLPLVILVNLGSASAAEIVAGCLQDSRRETVVLGEQTFGKVSVQTILPNPDG